MSYRRLSDCIPGLYNKLYSMQLEIANHASVHWLKQHRRVGRKKMQANISELETNTCPGALSTSNRIVRPCTRKFIFLSQLASISTVIFLLAKKSSFSLLTSTPLKQRGRSKRLITIGGSFSLPSTLLQSPTVTPFPSRRSMSCVR